MIFTILAQRPSLGARALSRWVEAEQREEVKPLPPAELELLVYEFPFPPSVVHEYLRIATRRSVRPDESDVWDRLGDFA